MALGIIFHLRIQSVSVWMFVWTWEIWVKYQRHLQFVPKQVSAALAAHVWLEKRKQVYLKGSDANRNVSSCHSSDHWNTCSFCGGSLKGQGDMQARTIPRWATLKYTHSVMWDWENSKLLFIVFCQLWPPIPLWSTLFTSHAAMDQRRMSKCQVDWNMFLSFETYLTLLSKCCGARHGMGWKGEVSL